MQWSKFYSFFSIQFCYIIKKGDMMKKIFTILFFLFFLVVAIFHEQITKFLMENVIYKRDIIIQQNNPYTLGNNFSFVQITDNFNPTSKQDIKNIIYTYLDRGWNDFSFYCNDIYPTCVEDVKEIANDSNTLSSINNFVHPFNAYEKLYISVNNLGKVTIETKKLYNEVEEALLNEKIDLIMQNIIKEDMTEKDKIKAVHDYIINHSVYDEKRAEAIKANKDLNVQTPSHKAIGPLIKGAALCSGYSDAMALFLDKMNIKNYKIASENHVWNFINLDQKWYHLDLTWDDPIVSTHENLLLYDFFLISTEKLKSIDLEQHNFNSSIYEETNL